MVLAPPGKQALSVACGGTVEKVYKACMHQNSMQYMPC